MSKNKLIVYVINDLNMEFNGHNSKMKLLDICLASGLAAGTADACLGKITAADIAVVNENSYLQSKVSILTDVCESTSNGATI